MKVTVFQHAGDPAFEPIHAEFTAPGGTVGRSAENHLALPDATREICRVQAAIRIHDAGATGFLMNLSSMSAVNVNGQPVARDQEVPLNPGDELEIGGYRLRAEAVTATADPEPAPLPPTHTEDIFSDLIGPGTLPVGSVPDVSTHPFDLDSAAARNPDDPLRHLPRGDATVSRPVTDPLALFDAPNDGSPSVFADGTPSTLPVHDPLAEHRTHPVDDALRGPREATDGRAAADHLREIGGFMRPAPVKKAPDDKSR
ncbi:MULTISPECIES: FHA domain-containing protein [Achromobacter]|uniref:FHA domain-containing protein n=1 Tax=Achromobacter spanius TaxID=217203 RepID=A0ABY8GNR1_9BURK|nr:MULTISPECIES: FHA domain-containing protein [Achromobacter]WAI84296.1 FHA domain-containing protein [Achromobacter spanius]WEX94378.1 FHA domain-containing protein [Achromobacter sp. SS2-2022]WFP06460.1 FHA domain-containing protein [Achromobacter spanius]